MRVGVLMIPTDPWDETVARARRLEDLGYDHLWTYDHLSWRRYRDEPWHAAIPWLTGVAAATSRIRIGTMVASPNFRHPVPLAKEAMTLDHVSGGRLSLGLGAGGIGFDDHVLGNPEPDAATRVARFSEFVELVDQLLREPETSYAGEHFTAHEARMIPGCVQQPRVPLVIGAEGHRTTAIAARHADAWLTHGDPSSKDPVAAARQKLELFLELCERAGRDTGDVARIYMTGTTTDERPLASVGEFTEFVGRYRDAGFTDVVFHHPRPGDPVWIDDPEIVEQIGTEVLPTLAG